MKTPTTTLILGAVLSLFSASAVAQVDSEWRLFDVGTGDEYILANGTRLDIYRFDVDKMNIRVAFTWDSTNPITEYIDRVEWRIQHSGFASPFEYVTKGSADSYSWPMCQTITGGSQSPVPCSILQKEGSITINARAIYDDHGSPPVIALVAEASRAFRVTDTTPAVRVRSSSPVGATCSGSKTVCDEAVSNSPLWGALTGLCDSRPGEKLYLGKDHAYIQCP